jgi:hypothetical protein
MCGVAGVLAALAAPAARAQDVTAKAAERAITAADPDAVDPNLIHGEKWTIDFQFERPEPIVVTGPTGQKEIYWYMVYTVTNNTGGDRFFAPAFTLYGDNGVLRRAGIYPNVYETIKKTRKVRFLENAVQMIGKLLVGADNARTGVAIFAPLPPETTKFTVFVEGLSGEFIERAEPAAPPEAPKAVEPQEAGAAAAPEADKTVRLRKTMALLFDLPPARWWLTLDQPVFKSKKWTWR